MKRWNYRRIIKSIFLLLFIIFILSLITNKSSLSYQEPKYKKIYVSEGDTLWSIAEELKTGNYYKNRDVRDIIYDLKNINNIKSSNLYINQELLIPIE